MTKGKRAREKYAEKNTKRRKLYEIANRDKISARYYVRKALKDGVLIKQPCEICGYEAEAHHDDYTKPTKVRWLCSSCHQVWHRKNGEGKRG